MHTLTSLSALPKLMKNRSSYPGKGKINALLVALEVEGPDEITIKKGPDAGKRVSILKMILGDEDGSICKLTAWREVAELWGGVDSAPGAKRGDILLITSALVTV